jgi:hypothetical protein
MRTRLSAMLGIAAAAATPAVPAHADGEQQYAPKTWITQEDMGEYTEYNIPANIYIPGDPILLTEENMNTGPRINFVACPIHVDSYPTPLWFTEYEGEMFFIRAQQNSSGRVRAPQLKHKILVEGVISDEPPIGGARVLNPVNVSILPDLAPECNDSRPYIEGVAVKFAKRPPGPGSSGADRQQGVDRLWALVDRLDDPNYVPNPKVKWETKEFLIEFDFGSDMVMPYPLVGSAVLYAKDVQAPKFEIVGYRGSALLSNGEVLIEDEFIAEQRARNVETIVRDYVLPKHTEVIVRWDNEPAPATGNDFLNRRVIITVTPGARP